MSPFALLLHSDLLSLIYRSNPSKISQDVEAQQPQEEPAFRPPTTASVDPYAHSGRGGAGNWYSPSQQRATGTYTSESSAAATSTAAPANTRAPPTNFGGRGGAGNYNWERIEAEEKAKAERNETEKEKEFGVKKSVEEDVESGLRKPGQAHLREQAWAQGELDALGR